MLIVDMAKAHIIISGMVQGVGFRYFIRAHLKRLGLTGWAENSANEKVEAYAEGEKEKIVELIKECKKGPMLAEVRGVGVEWLP